MSYPQAFHTSCRNGLSGHAGFQFNAASSELDAEQLARIAAAHAGYRPPGDAPAEPSPEEIAALPVSLRYLPVEGVGPVVSRTAYVGREFRGAEGEPDSGRFGNYFSHVLVGAGGPDGPFGGLLPIELWEASHWSTTEAREPRLPRLERVEPGPLDLDRVFAELRPRPAPALAAVADAALTAVAGGPRLVVVEAEPEMAAAWVAWACFALPPDRPAELTFSTFDGRPRLADSVRVCVTTPACELDFAPSELGSSVVVVDSASPPPVAELSLYGRVLVALADQGPEAVGAAVRGLPSGLGREQAGAELAVAARRTDLVVGEEVPGVLAALRAALPRVAAAALGEMVAPLPSSGSPRETLEWGCLYAAARESADPDAGALVDESLRRLLDSLDDLPDDLPPIPSDSPTAPSAGALVRWLEMVSGAAETPRLGAVVAAGERLGLVGCNTALDKELAAAIATAFADPAVQDAYESIVRAGNPRVVEGVALELAAAAAGGEGLELLASVAADPVALRAVRARAEESADFESSAAWELLRARSDPSRRRQAVTALAARAKSPAHQQAIRNVYGPGGPVEPREHAELLEGWAAAGVAPPSIDRQSALDCLAGIPLVDGDVAGRLVEALGDGPSEARRDPEYRAWRLALERPPQRPWHEWAEAAARLVGEGELRRGRKREVRELAARTAVNCLGESDHLAGLEALLGAMGSDWPPLLGDALAARLPRSVNPARVLATAFVLWGHSRRYGDLLLDEALPPATRDLSPRRLEEVGSRFDTRTRPRWEDWLDRHPPRRAVSRAVRGVFRRGEGR